MAETSEKWCTGCKMKHLHAAYSDEQVQRVRYFLQRR